MNGRGFALRAQPEGSGRGRENGSDGTLGAMSCWGEVGLMMWLDWWVRGAVVLLRFRRLQWSEVRL